MIQKDIAKTYIIKSIWEYIEQGDAGNPEGIDYKIIEKTTTSTVKILVPCWKETEDLMSQWACIFEYILLNKANKIDTEYFTQITIRYNNAITFLKDISDDYCSRMRSNVSNNIVNKLFNVDKSINHPRVDFL